MVHNLEKDKNASHNVSFLNLGLTEELDRRLNAYVLKIAAKKGKIPHGLRTAIARAALKNWLDKNENDLTLEF